MSEDRLADDVVSGLAVLKGHEHGIMRASALKDRDQQLYTSHEK